MRYSVPAALAPVDGISRGIVNGSTNFGMVAGSSIGICEPLVLSPQAANATTASVWNRDDIGASTCASRCRQRAHGRSGYSATRRVDRDPTPQRAGASRAIDATVDATIDATID